jgi:tagatose-1,6-bisphosphate aldolase
VTRTDQQRKAIEVYCSLLAEAFTAAGYDKVAVLSKKAIPVSWNQDSVKADLFKTLMMALCYDKDGNPKTSTAKLDVMEVNEIYKHLDKWTGEQFGIHVEFPSVERTGS